MRSILLTIALLSLLTGCSRSCRDTSLYQRTGQIKPIVTVMPVINSAADRSVPWDYSREFTDEIRKRMFDSSKLYLLREGGSMEFAKELNIPNPEQLPIDAKDQLGATEFVVITEFLNQEEVPYGLTSARPYLEEMGSVLSLAMRVRVVDVRKEQPKVILQDVIDYDHIIAKPYMKTDYVKASWGTEAFERTPLGAAHSKVVREVVAHVENYVIAAH